MIVVTTSRVSVMVAVDVRIFPAEVCATSKKSFKSHQWVTDIFSSMIAPDEWAWSVEPATPLVTPVILSEEIPVKLTYSLNKGVAVPLASSLSIHKTPGATSPVTEVSVIVVSPAAIVPFRVLEKAFVVATSHRLIAILVISFHNKKDRFLLLRSVKCG